MRPTLPGILAGQRRFMGRFKFIRALARLDVILLLVFGIFLTGCRTPPDLRPFADATSQLSGSIKTSGRIISAELASMPTNWPADDRELADKIATQFDHQWTGRNALADALLNYSASLTAIAQAGEEGQESVHALASSFKGLCSAVGVAIPAASGAGSVVDVGALLYDKFARDNAAKTLGEGMTKLQPAIDETAVVLGHSLQQIETGLDAIRDQLAQNVEDEDLPGTRIKVRTWRNNVKILWERHSILLSQLEQGEQARYTLRTNLLKTADPAQQKDYDRIRTLNDDITSELAAVERSLAVEIGRLAPIEARKAADYERLTAEIAMVRAARAGMTDWAAAHSRIAAAALEKKPLQVEDLLQSALEIRDLIETVRTPKKE